MEETVLIVPLFGLEIKVWCPVVFVFDDCIVLEHTVERKLSSPGDNSDTIASTNQLAFATARISGNSSPCNCVLWARAHNCFKRPQTEVFYKILRKTTFIRARCCFSTALKLCFPVNALKYSTLMLLKTCRIPAYYRAI